MMRVTYEGKRRFRINIRKHEIFSDLSGENGGDDTAPTPPELFISSIGTCVGIYVTSYLRTIGLSEAKVTLDLGWALDSSKTRIGKINISINVPGADLKGRKQALISAAEKCLIHNTLNLKPEITFNVNN